VAALATNGVEILKEDHFIHAAIYKVVIKKQGSKPLAQRVVLASSWASGVL
jgi:hypothetical protein